MPLVGGCQRDPYMVIAGRAVEVAGRREDAEVGEAVDGDAAGFAEAGPQVQSGLRVVDPVAGGDQRGGQDLPPRRVPVALDPYVLVVAQQDGHSSLYGRGHHHPEMFAHVEQLAHDGGVATDEARAVAGQVRPLRQRVGAHDAVTSPPLIRASSAETGSASQPNSP